MSDFSINATIVAVYLLAMLGFGLWVGRGQRDLNDYFLADKSLPWWAVLFSIVATETSTVTFLSIPGMAFSTPRRPFDFGEIASEGNLSFLQITFGYVVGRFLVAYVLLPAYFGGATFTAYEILEKRLGLLSRRLASLLFMVTRTLADGLRLLLTAIVLKNAVELDAYVCVLAISGVTILFTVVGGMRSVMWNDCIQFAVYMLGAIVAAVVIVQRIPGGVAGIFSFAEQGDKLQLLDFDWSIFTPTITFWSGLIGGAFLTIATHGADQMTVQRCLAARNLRQSQVAMIGSGIVVFFQFALFLMIGVGLACFYSLNPPDKPINASDEVFARFIVTQLPVGVIGIVLAAVFSAAISTLSSSLNSSATAFINDFYIPFKTGSSDRELLWTSRLATLFFGATQVIVAIVSFEIGLQRTIVDQVLSIAGYTTSLILGLLALSLIPQFTRLPVYVRQNSALFGFIVGFSVVTWVAFGTYVNWPWYTLIGSSTTVAAAFLAAPWFVRRSNSSIQKES